MRKLSKVSKANNERYQTDDERHNERPRCISGATITAWHGTPEVDLNALFAGPASGPSVTGSANPTMPKTTTGPSDKTLALSDGTRITFVSSDEVKTVATV